MEETHSQAQRPRYKCSTHYVHSSQTKVVEVFAIMIRILSVDFHERTAKNTRAYVRTKGILYLLRDELSGPIDDVSWRSYLGLWSEVRE